MLEADGGRRFLRRKAIDVASTFVLMALVLVSLVLVFVGGGFARDLLGFIGIGPEAARTWNVVRWPGALAVAMLVFAYIYYVTPDVKQRSFRAVLPGAAVGVLLWLAASIGFSEYISQVANVGAIYGTFTGAILLVAWLWLTHVALLLRRRAQRGDRARAGADARACRWATRSTGRRGAAAGERAAAGASTTIHASTARPIPSVSIATSTGVPWRPSTNDWCTSSLIA